MRKWLSGLGLLSAIVAVVGCGSQHEILRPPKNPEEFRTPSSTDPRYTNPPDLPKDLLHQDSGPRNQSGAPATPGSFGKTGGRFGAGQ